MSHDLAAALLRDVPRYASPDGNMLSEEDVLAALTAALDGVDERAGELVNRLRDAGLIATRAESADLITAILAQNAALQAERDGLLTTWAESRERHLAAEAEVEKLRGAGKAVLHDIDELVANSEGVAGLHMNGDVAEWSSLMDGGAFGAWLSSVEALRAALTTEADK